MPLPPADANVFTTACDYCIVACGYRVFTWPEGQEGGQSASENALGKDLPIAIGGSWISPNQHKIGIVDGERHHIVVQPDPNTKFVNRGGNHSIRGGTLAGKIYNPDSPTGDRLKTPLMRVNGELTPVSWDTAIDVMTRVSKHVLDKYGKPAWGMKTYSYAYFENTYAISKLAFRSIGTPAYSPHDKPGPGNDTPGIDDSGIIPFSASYEDWADAEVLFISGTDPFETKTVLFTEWIMSKPKKMIFTLPRKSAGVTWAEQRGGLYLGLIPGSDTVLHLALIRIILENGWEDKEFIDEWLASAWDIDSGMGRGTRNTPWQWRTTWGQLGTDFEGYKSWIMQQEHAELANAARITGLTEQQIRETAEVIAKPVNGVRPKTSFAFEKGNYWSNNYLNTASYAALGLICGAGNRPGQVISRLGGHQRGWMGGASYPRIQSPNKMPGRRRQEIDLDRWLEAGHLKFVWVMGTMWIQAMAASDEFYKRWLELTTENPNQITSTDPVEAADALIRRADSGGMVVVNSEVYLREPISTDLSDIILPASGWGESDFVRANGERRLRLYQKFNDAPGDAKPDWWAIAQFGKKMGFKGYDWQEANDVFEEAARFSRGGILNYHALVVKAKEEQKTGHAKLKEYGTDGIQTPIRLENGQLVGTKRLHDTSLRLGSPEGSNIYPKWMTHFKSQTGKAMLNKSPWEWFSDFYDRITPQGDELWVTSGRMNEIWQSAYDDVRKPYIFQRWPEHFVEIHPDDAGSRGIESGDEVEITNDDVLIQTGGFNLVKGDEFLFSKLDEAGLIKVGSGRVTAVALVTDATRQGVIFANFAWPRWPDSAANALVHRVPDPIANRYRFKLGKGKLRRLGESPFKHSFEQASLKPRTIG